MSSSESDGYIDEDVFFLSAILNSRHHVSPGFTKRSGATNRGHGISFIMSPITPIRPVSSFQHVHTQEYNMSERDIDSPSNREETMPNTSFVFSPTVATAAATGSTPIIKATDIDAHTSRALKAWHNSTEDSFTDEQGFYSELTAAKVVKGVLFWLKRTRNISKLFSLHESLFTGIFLHLSDFEAYLNQRLIVLLDRDIKSRVFKPWAKLILSKRKAIVFHRRSQLRRTLNILDMCVFRRYLSKEKKIDRWRYLSNTRKAMSTWSDLSAHWSHTRRSAVAILATIRKTKVRHAFSKLRNQFKSKSRLSGRVLEFASHPSVWVAFHALRERLEMSALRRRLHQSVCQRADKFVLHQCLSKWVAWSRLRHRLCEGKDVVYRPAGGKAKDRGEVAQVQRSQLLRGLQRVLVWAHNPRRPSHTQIEVGASQPALRNEKDVQGYVKTSVSLSRLRRSLSKFRRRVQAAAIFHKRFEAVSVGYKRRSLLQPFRVWRARAALLRHLELGVELAEAVVQSQTSKAAHALLTQLLKAGKYRKLMSFNTHAVDIHRKRAAVSAWRAAVVRSRHAQKQRGRYLARWVSSFEARTLVKATTLLLRARVSFAFRKWKSMLTALQSVALSASHRRGLGLLKRSILIWKQVFAAVRFWCVFRLRRGLQTLCRRIRSMSLLHFSLAAVHWRRLRLNRGLGVLRHCAGVSKAAGLFLLKHSMSRVLCSMKARVNARREGLRLGLATHHEVRLRRALKRLFSQAKSNMFASSRDELFGSPVQWLESTNESVTIASVRKSRAHDLRTSVSTELQAHDEIISRCKAFAVHRDCRRALQCIGKWRIRTQSRKDLALKSYLKRMQLALLFFRQRISEITSNKHPLVVAATHFKKKMLASFCNRVSYALKLRSLAKQSCKRLSMTRAWTKLRHLCSMRTRLKSLVAMSSANALRRALASLYLHSLEKKSVACRLGIVLQRLWLRRWRSIRVESKTKAKRIDTHLQIHTASLSRLLRRRYIGKWFRWTRRLSCLRMKDRVGSAFHAHRGICLALLDLQAVAL